MIKSILISLGTGILSALLTKDNMDIYSKVNTLIEVPKIVFPIVWTILYILMGISSYKIYKSNNENKKEALIIYGLQLLTNFIWSIIFFNLKNFLLAFIWIVGLDILVIAMIISFYKINKKAALLQLPYLLWSLFATLLTYQIYILN